MAIVYNPGEATRAPTVQETLPAHASSLEGKVLVLGEDTRGFLTSIRSFGRSGLKVHTAWCPLNSAALRSKYVVKNHFLPPYQPSERGWLDAFCRLLSLEKFDLVLPCTDSAILPLQMHREEVLAAGRVHLLPAGVFEVCASKARTHALARELGIPVPEQTTVADLASLREAAVRFGFPLVLKPETSAVAEDPSNRRTVVKVLHAGELERVGTAILSGGPVLAQPNFIGSGVGVEFLAKDGGILTAFQHERVHEMPGGGLSGYRRSVPLDPGMYGAAAQLARELRYTGLAMVEFRQNPRTREWVLIEINARVWGSLPLSVAAGIDFPRYLYEMEVLGRTEFPRKYREYFYCRHWISDIEWLRANAAADRNDPTLVVRSWRSIAAEAGIVLSLRECSDTLQRDDPAPAFDEMRRFFGAKSFGLLKRFGFYRAWSGKRAARAFAEARNVLFVCYGNICRSPFAERRLKQLAPGLTVSSSGFHRPTGRHSPGAAVTAAANFGVDLATHRSTVLDPALIETADVIYIFDHDNRSHMEREFTGFESKLHFLGGLDAEGPLEVADPYGGDVGGFEYCYGRIDRALRVLTGG